MTDDVAIPTYRDLLLPTLVAVDALGGSAENSELDEKVVAVHGITEDQLGVEYPEDATVSGSKVVHRLAFARSALKAVGALDNSTRGVWSLTQAGAPYLKLDPTEAEAKLRKADGQVRAERRKAKEAAATSDEETDHDAEDAVTSEGGPDWKDHLLGKIKTIDPAAFERLAMRLLREAGFRNVEVLGKSGDGGIDGVGVYKVSPLLSFPSYFQCKRYAGSVSSGAIRDFRGAMAGRGDKGLVITTGTFTVSAKAEASRDGAPPIDLIDGDALCDLLKLYELGVSTRVVEEVVIDEGFFDGV